mmetsp:Transcript_116446/g.238192  ORF Transcript_116446/g.238192 Transcript_116446/m.238192 type:complete len:121 (-) Transcript_116446:1368-1730(-)
MRDVAGIRNGTTATKKKKTTTTDRRQMPNPMPKVVATTRVQTVAGTREMEKNKMVERGIVDWVEYSMHERSTQCLFCCCNSLAHSGHARMVSEDIRDPRFYEENLYKSYLVLSCKIGMSR